MQNKKLFVRNLALDIDNSELGALFRSYGRVLSVRIPTDRQTGRCRGFGFVEMATNEAATEAMQALNRQQFGGRKIQVQFSQEHDHRALAYGAY